ncbi:MAG: FecR family protein [Myxococcota bacterium]|nr:FecR family protein [Myxococcota bacterium]
MTILVVLGLFACSKGEKKAEPTPTAKAMEPTKEGKTPDKVAAKGDASADVGINAGGIKHDAKEGSLGAITTVKGTVEVRRLGETTYAPAKDDTQVYGGDVVRTGENATATITLADESVVEVAEVSTIGIASRHGSADPSSSAAVLSGVARFTVSPRAPGEGAFRVYAPGAVILKGSTFGVGVAGSGEARVGVETGTVDVIGLAKLDAKPVTVEGGASVVLAANGDVGSPSPWPTNDWGTWRDEADAKIEVGAALDAHAKAMTQLSGSLKAGYADLSASADSVATFEANAAASAGAGDTAKYEAALPDGAATIDASFAVAANLELQTWAYASHAALATDLYIRHPAQVEAQWTVIAPSVDAAVLWPKRFEVTAVGYLDPLRMQYYVHHPRGRIHAPLVGIVVPEFYAKVTVPEIDGERVRGRVKTKIWLAPDVRFVATTRPVWISAPSADWRVKVKVAPPPMRGNVDFYVRPPSLKAKILVGANATGSWASKLTVAAPEPRMNLRAAWSIPVGAKVVVAAPDLAFAAKARAGMKLDAGGRVDARARIDAPPPPDIDAKAKIKAKVDVRVPEVKMPSVKGKIGIGVGGGAGAGAGGGGAAAGADVKAKAGAAVKVKAPEVKVKAPEVKVKGEAKGKIKIGL